MWWVGGAIILMRIIEVIREKVQDGVTGETREIQYTQCKIVGNGSFGVVFQTKLSPSNEDAAIKRVLQDKRFKVSILQGCVVGPRITTDRSEEPRTANYADCATSQYCPTEGFLLLKRRARKLPGDIPPSRAYAHDSNRKMRCTSILCKSSCLRQFIGRLGSSTR